MDFGNIITIISQVGFPIAVCLICFWYIYHNNEAHKEEIGKLSEAVNNNTIVINKLIEKLEKE